MAHRFSDQPPEEKLRAEFHQAMLELYNVAARRGYRATRFRTMVEEWGGVETAKRLLAKPGVQDGLMRLWELDLLEHSTEAIVLQDRFRRLFTEEELEEARSRLEQFGFFSE